jgi:arylsulfatase A-like enzyme
VEVGSTFFAGKWHLGETEEYWPEHQGFDTNIGGHEQRSTIYRKNTFHLMTTQEWKTALKGISANEIGTGNRFFY